MLIPALTDLSGDARFFEGNIVDSVSYGFWLSTMHKSANLGGDLVPP
jgi:hypothetical protein